MKIIMINGSPKVGESNSGYLLEELKKLVQNDNEIIEYNIRKESLDEKDLETICNCDTLVFGFPLYVDGLPSHLLQLLANLEAYFKNNDVKNLKVYAVVNCGFYEGEQTHLALDIIKNWCKKANLTYCQGLGTGAGEMLGSIRNVPLGHGPKKNLGNSLNIISKNILKGEGGENMFISPNLPRIAFRLCANYFWNMKAKGNGLNKKDLY